MKGNKKIIDRLNELLADELAAISQYIVQSEMCENFGYERLHGALKKQAIEEMKHAEKLIARILFLEGMPDVTKLGKVSIGKNVAEHLKNSSVSEAQAIRFYNESIALATENADIGTADLLRCILAEEEHHLDWLETQRDQMEQLGVEKYLAEQIK